MTPNLPTNTTDFRGLDSSIIFILSGRIIMSIGDFPDSLSQAMLVVIMLVERSAVLRWDRHGVCVASHDVNRVYIYIYIYIYIYMYTHICMYVCMYVCMYMYRYTHTYVCIHIYIYIYIYIHTVNVVARHTDTMSVPPQYGRSLY